MDPIEAMKAGSPEDLFGRLRAYYLSKFEPTEDSSSQLLAPDEVDLEYLDDFLAECRKFFKENPPSGMTYVGGGLGLRLVTGDVLLLNSDPAESEVKDYAQVTTPRRGPKGRREVSTDNTGTTLAGPSRVAKSPTKRGSA